MNRRDFNKTLLAGATLATTAGVTEPFSAEKLAEMYPSRKDYVAKVSATAKMAQASGYILPARVDEYIKEAKQTKLG